MADPARDDERTGVRIDTAAGSYVLTVAESSPALVARSVSKPITVTVAGRVETRAGRSRTLPTGQRDRSERLRERIRDDLGDGIETGRRRAGRDSMFVDPPVPFVPQISIPVSPRGTPLPGALGIFAFTDFAPEVRVAVAATGAVTTYGDQADGVRLGHRGERIATQRFVLENPPGGGMPRLVLQPIPDDERASGRLVAEIAGAVRTSGAGAAALRARVEGGSPTETARGDIELTVAAGGRLETGGERAPAIDAFTEQGNIQITVDGTARTGGNNSLGVDAETRAGNVTVTTGAQSLIQTAGRGAHGVDAETRAGNVTVTTGARSQILTRGAGAHGLRLRSRGPAPGADPAVPRLSATVAGTVRAMGEGAAALLAEVNDRNPNNRAQGDIELTVAAGGGLLETTGANSPALAAVAEQGDVQVRVDGTVLTAEGNSGGVIAQTQVGNVTVTTGAQSRVQTAGTGAAALLARVDDGNPTTTTAQGDIEVSVAAGDPRETGLETRGANAPAIGAFTEQGNIQITVDGSARTEGNNSLGVDAQTRAGNVTVTTGAQSLVQTAGTGAAALLARVDDGNPATTTAQGDIEVSVAAGGRLETGGERAPALAAFAEQGNIDINVNGTARTAGERSLGVFAQTQMGNVEVDTGSESLVQTARGNSTAIRASTQSGVVRVRHGGAVRTAGERALGIDAFSFLGPVDVITGANSLVETGGERATGIQATAALSTIDVTVNGTVRTTGADALGIVALGGVGDVVVTVAANRRVETGGARASGVRATAGRGTTRIAVDGTVATAGAGAHGVDAQSRAGDVTVGVGGTIRTAGAGASALLARVDDGNPDPTSRAQGNISVTVAAGALLESSGADAAALDAMTEQGDIDIAVDGTVRATGAGSVAVQGAVPLGAGRLRLTVRSSNTVVGPTAVAWTGGSADAAAPNDLVVTAGGQLTGALALGDGADRLENRGVLNLLGPSRFGAGTDRFVQAGRLEPGGAGRVATVAVEGIERVDFEPSSVLAIEVDGMAGRTDQLQFSATGPDGSAVTLAGTIEVRELPGRGNFRTGERRFAVVTSNGALDGAGALQLSSPARPADRIIQRRYRLEQPGPSLTLVEITTGSFVVPGTNGNVESVGRELDLLTERTDLPMPVQRVISRLGDMTPAELERAAGRLHAEPYDALLQGSWHAERGLVETLWRGCAAGPKPDSGCAFGVLFGRNVDRVRGRDHSGFEELAVGPRGGVSRRLGELAGRAWELRLGAAYEALDLTWRDGGGGRGDRLLGGVALHSRGVGGATGDPDPSAAGGLLAGLDAGLAVTGGGAWFETERAIQLLGIGTAEAEPRLSFVGGHGRLVYRLGAPPGELGGYAEAGLEGGVVALWLGSFRETEATGGAFRLQVAETRERVTTVSPRLALGGAWQWGELRFAPRARLGLQWAVGGEDTAFRARLAAVSRGRGFRTRGDREALLIEAGGSVGLSWSERLSFELAYTGRVSPDGTTRDHEGQLRAELRF